MAVGTRSGKYAQLDEQLASQGDIEGEEWKHGLAPGETPPMPPWIEESRRAWEEEQRKYDQPDERPRELDWSDREYDDRRSDDTQFNDDDIPF